MGSKLSKKKQQKSPEAIKQENEEKKLAKKIDTDIKAAKNVDEKVIKLLLLGAGESGKSTLFKQSIHIFGKGFDKQQMEMYIPAIHKNVMYGMSTLVTQSDILGQKYQECKTGADVQQAKDYFKNMALTEGDDVKLTSESAAFVKTLWANQGIRNTFRLRSKFQCPDSAAYFFDSIDRIALPDYSPTYDDILRVRARTTGIVESMLNIDSHLFKIIDVGGQKSERKKWYHCFDGVTAIIFVAAINEYDQVLFEDNETNRMLDALNLFNEVVNNPLFQKINIILFLNKRDLFSQKIQTIDLNVCFPDYTGGLNYELATEFLAELFKKQQKNDPKQPRQQQIFCHITCATDPHNVQFTLDSVKTTIINSSIIKSGLA